MTVNDIRDYHAATGCPLDRAKVLLSAMSPELRERVLLAARQKSGGKLLVDPIESDSTLADKVRDAAQEAERAADLRGCQGRGRSHVVWATQKNILADRHGITWFSPKDMNPEVVFD
jgi:hypothetical protein